MCFAAYTVWGQDLLRYQPLGVVEATERLLANSIVDALQASADNLPVASFAADAAFATRVARATGGSL